MSSDGPKTASGRWKREHPERAREYNRVHNARRKSRRDQTPCPNCGGPKWWKAALCWSCREDERWRAVDERARGP